MICNEEQNVGTLFWIDIEPVQCAIGNIEAGLDVIAIGDTFASVVQQKSQIEDLRILELGEQLEIALVPLRL